MNKFTKSILSNIADFSDLIATLGAGEVSSFNCYQPEEPESVRKAAEARRQAKLAKRAAKKSK
ncbi:MAG: cyclic lactone autoinducer peptide [Oscillospiraceae bacterium]|nr:cyclic lactone autoinducer peptide [Oscillospiraceae bacterium]MDY3258647.1 cyclic lactone autoinducer peptide [Ruminococcus callidus]